MNFVAAAAIASVSRQFLYSNPDLSEEMDRLRREKRTTLSRTAVQEHASDASIRTRLRAALDDNQRLREQLAVAHGIAREFQLARRTGRAVQ